MMETEIIHSSGAVLGGRSPRGLRPGEHSSQPVAYFCGAHGLNGYYISKWLGRGIKFHDLQKLCEIEYSVFINALSLGHSHAGSFSCVWELWQRLWWAEVERHLCPVRVPCSKPGRGLAQVKLPWSFELDQDENLAEQEEPSSTTVTKHWMALKPLMLQFKKFNLHCKTKLLSVKLGCSKVVLTTTSAWITIIASCLEKSFNVFILVDRY